MSASKNYRICKFQNIPLEFCYPKTIKFHSVPIVLEVSLFPDQGAGERYESYHTHLDRDIVIFKYTRTWNLHVTQFIHFKCLRFNFRTLSSLVLIGTFCQNLISKMISHPSPSQQVLYLPETIPHPGCHPVLHVIQTQIWMTCLMNLNQWKGHMIHTNMFDCLIG